MPGAGPFNRVDVTFTLYKQSNLVCDETFWYDKFIVLHIINSTTVQVKQALGSWVNVAELVTYS